jgi:hypothetical protein
MNIRDVKINFFAIYGDYSKFVRSHERRVTENVYVSIMEL